VQIASGPSPYFFFFFFFGAQPVGVTSMAKKQSSPKVSSLASKVLSGTKKPTQADAKKLAASVLSQDEKGKRR
jgi:hypothetical protein